VSIPILSPLDAQQNDLKNALLDPRTSDPSSPVSGQAWIRTDLGQLRGYVGTSTRILSNCDAINFQTGNSYTVTDDDEDVFFVSATTDVAVTLGAAANRPGKRVRLWNLNATHYLNISRGGSDAIVGHGVGNVWNIDPGLGLGVEFLSVGTQAGLGGAAWVVVGGYGMDVYWGWMNKLIPDMANANYAATGLEWGITNTVGASGDLNITLPATVSTFNKSFIRIYDSSGSASGTKRLILVPNGTETINGVNANFVAVASAYGWVELQGDANGHWFVSQPGTIGSLAWSSVTATPTTLAGYGITDAAPAASPTLTGTPLAPTAAVDTNTTQIATTAMVLAQAASATPIIDGTGTVGTSTRFARGDHVHPSDTTRVPIVTKKDGTGALTTFTMVTVGASNAEYLMVSNVAFSGTVTISTTISWTDENGNVMSVGSGNQAAAGNTFFAPGALGIFAKASTAITVVVTVVSGTAAKAAYHFHLLGPI
jgi:hypothetical protein